MPPLLLVPGYFTLLLMNPAFTEIGAGYAVGPFGGNPAARFWTFDLADRQENRSKER